MFDASGKYLYFLASTDAGPVKDWVIPGVGAFGIAMDVLERTGHGGDHSGIGSTRGTPVVGICLGMQLMMSSSTEFGARAEGWGLSKATRSRSRRTLTSTRARGSPTWDGRRFNPATPLAGVVRLSVVWGLAARCYSCIGSYVRPANPGVALSVSSYRGATFCSSLVKDHVFGCQFHPERSSIEGLEIYRRIAAAIRSGEPSEA